MKKKGRGTCRLCQKQAELQESHIIPRWAYRRITKLHGKVAPNPVKVSGDTAMYSPKQDKEYLLCEDCEQLFSKNEKYVASIVVQENGAFPALSQVKTIGQLAGADFACGVIPNLDNDSVIRFAASVIWRSSVGSMYPNTKLGPYERVFADYLLGKTSYPTNSCLVVELIKANHGPHVDQVVVATESARDGHYHVHKFAIFGIVFLLYVGNDIPDEIMNYSFSGHHYMIVTDGQILAESLLLSLKKTTPKGSLAREGVLKND